MMDIIEIEKRIKKIILENLMNCQKSEIDFTEIDDFTFLMITSLDFIKIIVSIEKKFDLEFDEDEMDVSLLSSIKKIAKNIYVKKNADCK